MHRTTPLLRASCAVAAAVSVAAAPAPCAAADAVKAAKLFRDGAAAFARHDYRTAAADFEAADQAAPHGAPLYNAGLAWAAAGEQPRAADAYASALARGGLQGAELADAQARLAALEKSLGRIDVQAPGGEVSLEQVQRAKAPVRVHVAPGTYDVSVLFQDGRVATRSVEVSAGAVASIVVEPPRRETAPVAPPPTALPAQRVAGFISLGTGVAVSGVAIGTGVAALSARSAFLGSGDVDRAAHDRAASLRTTTNVAWAAAGVLGAVGLALVLTAPSTPRVTAFVRIGPRGFAACGRF